MGGIKLLVFVIGVLFPNVVYLVPVPEITTSLVIVSTSTENVPTQETEKSEPVAPPELKSMQVESNITNRYGHTVVSSRYKNPADIAQETTFSIILPDTAFISGFSMEIKGKTYDAYVKEKEEAKREYQQAIESGFGAAHIEQNARDSNKFTVSVNVEPRSKVTFNLSYEELLVRKHGRYEMVINLHPGQLVKDLIVNVNINETKRLVNVKTPALRSGNEIIEDNQNNINEYATVSQVGEDGKAVHVHFAPTVRQQKEMAKKLQAVKKEKLENDNNSNETTTLAGQFVIEYDVERDTKGGEILVNDGYFVHFFAPADLKPLPKHAVFVLDVSGSMTGRKIEQLKQAMHEILDELKPEDYFNVIEFSFSAKVWNFDNVTASPTYEMSRKFWWRQPDEVVIEYGPEDLPPAFPATPENKKKAKKIIEDMVAGGGTNIYDALQVALNLTANGVPDQDNKKTLPLPIVIFLTDGDATDGETDTQVILNKVDEFNDGGETAAVFSLAFGYDANKDFLKKLSLKNSGFMRQIYEASDASLQLQDFYKQISSPLLANVTFKYPEGQTESVTKHSFHTFFDGSEFVVAGKMENIKDKILYVHGLTNDGPIDFSDVFVPAFQKPEVKQEVGPLERLWAYMTIKELLDKKDELLVVENSTEADDLTKQALKLALKYSFVTPVTSLVVVKPNETEKVDAEESRKFEPGYGYPIALNAPFASSGFSGGGGFAGGGFGGGFPAGSFVGAPAPGVGAGGGYQPQMIYRSSGQYPEAPQASFETYAYDEVDHVEESTVMIDTNSLLQLQWLIPLKPDPFHVIIDNKDYMLGDNSTVVDSKTCKVNSLNLTGNCTLLSACPRVYSKLDSYDKYFNEYFCKLPPTYAGVCCIDLNN